jgi:hypothetical protein
MSAPNTDVLIKSRDTDISGNNTVTYVSYNDDILDNLEITYGNLQTKFADNYEFLKFIPNEKATGSYAKGCVVSGENSGNSSINMTLLDSNLHTRESCKLGAAIAFSDIKYNERKALDSGNIKKVKGLSYKIVQGYFGDDTTYFLNTSVKGSGTSKDFSNITSATSDSGNLINTMNSGGHYYSVEWVGFVVPDVTGNWTFGTNSDDASYLWLDEKATNDYSIQNADVNNGGLHGMVYKEATKYLVSGKSYPIRMQFGENWGGRNFILSIKPPNNPSVSNYYSVLYTLQNPDGTPYEMKQMYYSLVENSAKNTANNLFNCYITDPNSATTSNQLKMSNSISRGGYNNTTEYEIVWRALDETAEASLIKAGNYAKIDNTGKLSIYDSTNNIVKTLVDSENNVNSSSSVSGSSSGQKYMYMYLDSNGNNVSLKTYRWNNGWNLVETVFNSSISDSIGNYNWYLQRRQENIQPYLLSWSVWVYPTQIDSKEILISSDSKYKLKMTELGNLVLLCSKKPCSKTAKDVNNNKFVYTNGNTRYLYNLKIDEKMNKMFYANDLSMNLEFVPNDSPVVSSTNYSKIGNYVPIPSNISKSVKVTSQDSDGCKKMCDNTPGCENFYYYTTNDNNKWCNLGTNTSSNIVPPNLFNILQPGTNITSSELYIKDKKLNMDQKYMPQEIPVNKMSSLSSFSNYSSHTILPNSFTQPHIIGVGSEPEYISWKGDQNKILFGTNKQGFTTLSKTNEGFQQYDINTCTSDPKGCISNIENKKINPLIEMSGEYSKKIQQMKTNDIALSGNVTSFSNTYTDLSNNNLAQFSPQFTNFDNTMTIKDAMNNDLNEMLVQQNNMYIMGTIAAATLLVTAILIGKE